VTPINFLLVLCTQLCAVTGQIFVKKAMTLPAGHAKGRGGIMLVSGS
jgi:hypothetical protein